MVIEIVLSFFIKHSRRYILTCRRCPLAGLNGNEALCCHILMGMKPSASDWPVNVFNEVLMICTCVSSLHPR